MKKISFALFCMVMFSMDAHAAERKGKAWIVAGIHLSTLDPNIRYAYLWCRNLATDKRFRCIGPKGGGFPKRTLNPITKFQNPASRQLHYGLGTINKIPTGKYQIDSLEISLADIYAKLPRKLLAHDLSPFGITFKVDDNLQYLGNFHFDFDVNNIYQLLPKKLVIDDDIQFTKQFMGDKLHEKFEKKLQDSTLQPVTVEITSASPKYFTKLNEWGVVPSFKSSSSCVGLFRKAKFDNGMLVVDKSSPAFSKPVEAAFPSELESDSLGCAIKKYLLANNYSEFKLSSKFEKPKVGMLVIPIDFR